MLSLTFLFIFLPLLAGVFFLLPKKHRGLCLLVGSVVFYACLQPWYILLMLADIWFAFKLAPVIAQGGRSGRNAMVWAAIANLALLVVSSALNQIYKIEMPLGLIIYTLTSLGYLMDIKSGEAQPEKSFVDFAVICCFFPKLYAGPLVSYNETIYQIKNLAPTAEEVGQGLTIFIKGLAKKIIIADSMVRLFFEIRTSSFDEITALSAWTLVIAATFSTYFTFSSLSDMAVGLGQVFGIKLPKNFNYPFEAASVSDFFARFNITVNNYINKHVFAHLGFEKGGTLSACFNLLLISMLMGLWYGLRPNLLVWGAVLGLFTILEIVIFPNFFRELPLFYGRIYTFAVTFFSFAIFAGQSLGESGRYLGAMFGLGGVELYNDRILYILSSNYLLLILSAIGATSIVSRMASGMRTRLSGFGILIGTILDVVLLALTVGFML